MRAGWLQVKRDGAGAGRSQSRVPARPGSPCQSRRASDRSERPEGARGGCSRNRRGPDTSSESSAVKKVADGTSGNKDQLRHPSSETAMAATAPLPGFGYDSPGSFLLPAPVSPGNSG